LGLAHERSLTRLFVLLYVPGLSSPLDSRNCGHEHANPVLLGFQEQDVLMGEDGRSLKKRTPVDDGNRLSAEIHDTPDLQRYEWDQPGPRDGRNLCDGAECNHVTLASNMKNQTWLRLFDSLAHRV
jgi:hypothetical protein